MTSPTIQNFYIEAGADFNEFWTLLNPDYTPINLANNTFSSAMKASFTSTNAYANLTITTADATNGNINLYMDAANTANLQPGTYFYDTLMTSNTGSVTKILKGIITVNPGITGIIPPYEGLPAQGGTLNVTIWMANSNTFIDDNASSGLDF